MTAYFRYFHWGLIQIKLLNVMAEERVVELTEADIPGASLWASLGGRDPKKFKITELKFWLRCQGSMGLTKLKTKADYVT